MLVVEDEVTNCLRELITLPLALASAGGLALFGRDGRADCFDRVGRRAEFVRGDVGDSPRLAGGVRRVPGGAARFSSWRSSEQERHEASAA